MNFWVFYWFDLVCHCTNKARCVLKSNMFHFLWRKMVWVWCKKRWKNWSSYRMACHVKRISDVKTQFDFWLVDFLFTLTHAPLSLAVETITPHRWSIDWKNIIIHFYRYFYIRFARSMTSWKNLNLWHWIYSSKVNNCSKWADQTFFYQRNLWLLQLPMVVSKFVIMIQRIWKVCRSKFN